MRLITADIVAAIMRSYFAQKCKSDEEIEMAIIKSNIYKPHVRMWDILADGERTCD